MSKRHKKTIAVFSAGLLFSRPLRRVVQSADYSLKNGWISALGRDLGVWGRIPLSRRVLARREASNVITFEDAFLRSVLPGLGSPPVGLNIDDIGVHFEGGSPSRLEEVLNSADLDDPDLLERAKNGLAFLRHYGLSKYNPVPRGHGDIPDKGFILVLDQVAGDASIEGGLATAETFAEMLRAAKLENPGKRIVIRTHPAVQNGKKSGHYSEQDTDENTRLLSAPLNPWDLLEAAEKVYCVSSQMGFEAILAGHKPEIFGLPFYTGWGLSADRQVTERRKRKLSAVQLFAGVMLVYPFWYDHVRRSACSFEEAARQLLAQARHHWDSLPPVSAVGMRLWKRKNVARFFENVSFANSDQQAITKLEKQGGKVVVWASAESENLRAECDSNSIQLSRMEDGFLRSSGLGAALAPASSLVLDNCGIYYDPSRPSQLENLIAASGNLPTFALKRAEQLRKEIIKSRVSKYNLSGVFIPDIPQDRKIILVPGQVEDDASIRMGADRVKTNAELLRTAREANSDAYIIYKPHPDVVAGLRDGVVDEEIALQNADQVITEADPISLIEICDEVWTITSLMGFEALLREKRVVCLGTPFYAGWGLTHDLAPACPRRGVNVTLDQLVHATLVDYPRYLDPVSKLPCTPELIVDRLAEGRGSKPPVLKVLSKVQGIFASYASIWR